MKAPRCRLCEKEHWGVCPVDKVSVIKGLREKVVNIAPVVANKEEVVANETKVVANVVANSRSSSTEEQRFCKPNVEGSIPSSGSKHGPYIGTVPAKTSQRVGKTVYREWFNPQPKRRGDGKSS